MKNREKFREYILSWAKNGKGKAQAYCEFARKNMIPNLTDCTDGGCAGLTCTCCRAIFSVWLDEEFEELPKPEVDWSNVPVDTLVRVRDDKDDEWVLRYFDSFNFSSMSGHNYRVFADGATSVTGRDSVEQWKYCELVEDEFDDEWNRRQKV